MDGGIEATQHLLYPHTHPHTQTHTHTHTSAVNFYLRSILTAELKQPSTSYTHTHRHTNTHTLTHPPSIFTYGRFLRRN